MLVPLPFRLKGTEKFIPRDSFNSSLYILFSMIVIHGLLTHVAVYFEFSNQSSCRIWGCCFTFTNCVQWFGGGSGALDSEHSNSNYENTNIFVL